MTEITIGSRTYVTGKLDAFTQLHIVRRLSPVLSSVGPVLKALPLLAGLAPSEDGTLPGALLDALDAALPPLAEAFGKLRDEDVEYIMSRSLSAVQAREGNALQRVWNAEARMAQYQDIDAVTMLRLTITVLRENLSGFFPALPSRSEGAQAA